MGSQRVSVTKQQPVQEKKKKKDIYYVYITNVCDNVMCIILCVYIMCIYIYNVMCIILCVYIETQCFYTYNNVYEQCVLMYMSVLCIIMYIKIITLNFSLL